MTSDSGMTPRSWMSRPRSSRDLCRRTRCAFQTDSSNTDRNISTDLSDAAESDSAFALLVIVNLVLRIKDHEVPGMTDKEPLEKGRWEEPIFPCDCDNVSRSDGGHECNTAQPACADPQILSGHVCQ